MSTYSISKSFGWDLEISGKAAKVMRMFGVTVDRLIENAVKHKCQLDIEAGDVVYITGPSGSGKSVLFRELEKQVPAEERINLADIELAGDKTLVDCIDSDFLESLRLLNTAGLNDVFCLLNSPANLSEGQKWRFCLAMALAEKREFIFADEFCTNLDRVTAAVIAYNVQRYAAKCGVVFVLAGTREDFLVDLAADVLVVKELSGGTEVIYRREIKN